MSVLNLKWRIPALLMALMLLPFLLIACSSEEEEKAVINFHDGQWATLWAQNAVAMYITEHGFGYPVAEIQGTTGTMKVALPQGDLDVNLEIWRINIPDWYDEFVVNGPVVDLAGTNEQLPAGSRGQSLASGGQAFYIPTFVADANPGLKSVDDLPDYVHLFPDPEDPGMGLLINCITGWQCEKINRAKWHAYGLFDTYNVQNPGSGGALDAAIKGAYDAGEPVLTYYWEPTSLLNTLDMTRLEEPVNTPECQAALDEAVVEVPYESTQGCGYPFGDVHIGVHETLVERAPEVTEFLSNFYIGAKEVGAIETWKDSNEKTWQEAGIHYLKNNEAIWTTWVDDKISDKVNKALENES